MTELGQALASQYPGLSREALDVLETAVMRQLAHEIREGRKVAFLRELPGGEAEISVMDVEGIPH